VKEKNRGFDGKIEMHLKLCYNEATDLQYEILAKQMPSMNQRIQEAYKTRVNLFISATLPEAKINFVSEESRTRIYPIRIFTRPSY
jgi:hypothetical protein